MQEFAIYEGVQLQREAESIRYRVTTTPWASNPSSVSVTLWDMISSTVENNVTSAKVTGLATVVGDDITLPNVHSLVKGHRYRLDVSFVSDGNTFVIPIIIKAIR